MRRHAAPGRPRHAALQRLTPLGLADARAACSPGNHQHQHMPAAALTVGLPVRRAHRRERLPAAGSSRTRAATTAVRRQVAPHLAGGTQPRLGAEGWPLGEFECFYGFAGPADHASSDPHRGGQRRALAAARATASTTSEDPSTPACATSRTALGRPRQPFFLYLAFSGLPPHRRAAQVDRSPPEARFAMAAGRLPRRSAAPPPAALRRVPAGRSAFSARSRRCFGLGQPSTPPAASHCRCDGSLRQPATARMDHQVGLPRLDALEGDM